MAITDKFETDYVLHTSKMAIFFQEMPSVMTTYIYSSFINILIEVL